MPHDNKYMDDLSYLAEKGFESVNSNDSDLNDLSKRVSQRVQGGSAGLALVSTIVGVFMGVTVFFSVYNKETVYSSLSVKQSVINETGVLSDSINEVVLDTIKVISENFTVLKNLTYGQLPDSARIQSSLITDSLMVFNLQPKRTIDSSSIKDDNLRLRFLINSSITYIHNFKVSDYQHLYYKRLLKDDLSGLPATLAAYEASDGSENRLKKYADNYLHEDVSKALLYFKKGSYDECINLFYAVSNYNNNDVNCNFYLGMCFYYKKNYSRAIGYFDRCLLNTNNAFVQEANYYKAVALEEANRVEEAINLFKMIADEGGFYSEKAKTKLN